MFVDFGLLPPEINSGKMYVGPGSGPMLAAAAAWDSLAADLQSVAASYGSTIQSLAAGPWTGPSSVTMAAAAMPYVAWINATSAQAEEAGTQAKLAAGAYETAFAATVPPPVIAANRALLAALVATNILGQNTPAIMATEAHYMEMWAQDSAAMYAYAGSSLSASQLTSFTEPPQTTNAGGTAAQSASVAQASTQSGLNTSSTLSGLQGVVQNFLTDTFSSTSLSSTQGNLVSGLGLTPIFPNLPAPTSTGLGTAATNWNTIWSGLAGVYSPLLSWTAIPGGPFLSFGQVYAYAQNGQALNAFYTPKAIIGALAPLASEGAHLSSAGVGGLASGSMGKAALVGNMSVPQGWTQAAPAIRTLSTVQALNDAAIPAAADMSAEEGMFSQMGLSSLAGRAMGAAAYGSGSGAAARSMGGVVEADPATATIIVIPALED